MAARIEGWQRFQTLFAPYAGQTLRDVAKVSPAVACAVAKHAAMNSGDEAAVVSGLRMAATLARVTLPREWSSADALRQWMADGETRPELQGCVFPVAAFTRLCSRATAIRVARETAAAAAAADSRRRETSLDAAAAPLQRKRSRAAAAGAKTYSVSGVGSGLTWTQVQSLQRKHSAQLDYWTDDDDD